MLRDSTGLWIVAGVVANAADILKTGVEAHTRLCRHGLGHTDPACGHQEEPKHAPAQGVCCFHRLFSCGVGVRLAAGRSMSGSGTPQ